MTFAHPWLLLLLLLLPLAAWLKGRRGPSSAFLYSSVKLAEGLTSATRSRVGTFLAAMQWLTLALFIIALAQPRHDRSETKVTASGVDIVVVFDMSGSMQSEDFEVRGGRVNRFNMARSVLEGFIRKRPNDRIGLVVFASQAYIATPLTLDHDFLQANLDRLQIGNIDANQTAIGSGGLWGRGLGQGSQAMLGFLPEPYNDFAFASFTRVSMSSSERCILLTAFRSSSSRDCFVLSILE